MNFGENLANLTAGKAKVILDCKIVTMPGVGPGFASTLCVRPCLIRAAGQHGDFF